MMMTNRERCVLSLCAALPLALAAVPTLALARDRVEEAKDTVELFKKADPDISRFLSEAVGYAVFPNVGKGGAGVGGAYGKGVVFEGGKPVGWASMTQVTVGLQLGGQAYSEIIFFETPKALADFKKSEVALAAQASAVIAASGASANAKYQEGVAVFTLPRGGLMSEASVGGQKFRYRRIAAR
jgi:lipid-binding SYLF domain-containing protein